MLKVFIFLSFPLFVFSQNLKYTNSLFHHSPENTPYTIKKEWPPGTPVIIDDQTEQSDSTQITVITLVDGSDESITFISLGIRFFGSHLAADFGLITSPEASGSFPFFPWLGFAYNF